jgi:hypothetical protein
MAATLEAVPRTKTVDNQTETPEADAARDLVRMAKERGLSLTGPDGLLKMLTKTVIETALDEELTGHLGYDRRGGAAFDQPVRHDLRPQVAGAEQLYYGHPAHVLERLGHGAQRRGYVQRGGGVVEAHDRDVLRHPEPRRCSSLTTAAPISSLIAKTAVRPVPAAAARRPRRRRFRRRRAELKKMLSS